jgi:hypothetical protein
MYPCSWKYFPLDGIAIVACWLVGRMDSRWSVGISFRLLHLNIQIHRIWKLFAVTTIMFYVLDSFRLACSNY